MLVILAAALIFGVTMTLPIGGADMPVVISLLNSFTGTAVAMAGFVIDNPVLIIAGALVGASGAILTKLMADAMNRSVLNIMIGGFGGGDGTVAGGRRRAAARSARSASTTPRSSWPTPSTVIVVPGYGLAVAQAQHAVRELAELLEARGVDVKYAIHPVAGRMPGHMNVLLAEANVPYPQLKEMDDINPEFERADVALVIGANDVTNPAARRPGSPVSGMPILDVDHAKSIIVIKRSMGQRLRRHRQRALHEPEDRDALRRREGRPGRADRGGQGACRSRRPADPAHGRGRGHAEDPQRPRSGSSTRCSRASSRRTPGSSGGSGRAAIVRADAPVAGKVAIVTGGGSGHLPVFMGYVGRGLLDGAAIGEVFASPSARADARGDARRSRRAAASCTSTATTAATCMNFDLAAELAGAEGIEVRTVLGAGRRRLGAAGAGRSPARASPGSSCLYKVAGARGRRRRVARRGRRGHDARRRRAADDGRRALAVHDPGGRHARRSSCPTAQMEIGMGIHGEPGVRRGAAGAGRPDRRRAGRRDPRRPATGRGGSRVAVLVNGLGATPKEELYILYRRVARAARGAGPRGPSGLGRRVRDVARDGRRVGQPACASTTSCGRCSTHPAATPFFVQA